jgi:polar amino acid transport system substrate-binding protein
MKWKCLILILVGLIFSTEVSAELKEVTLATLEYEPYVGSKMPNYGFATEIIVEAFKKAGYKVNIEFYPWDKGLEITKEGRVDGIYPAYYAKWREEHYAFSDPFASEPVGLCKIKSTSIVPGQSGFRYKTGHDISFSTDPRIDQTAALRELKQYKFGVVAGYVTTPEFDAATFLTKVEAPTDEENVRQLFQDKVQLIVIGKYVAQNIVAKKFPWRLADLEFMEPPLEIKYLYIAFSKQASGFEKKLKDFNAGLKLIKEDGILERIMSRYGF